ncbi:hypothetical protein ACTID9_03045 [Brevibacillus fluminis]|uniref:hypothetical protein n=1 Tax=Brevibacillus fluminis TaxID=511487 RepID=UPI003F88F288
MGQAAHAACEKRRNRLISRGKGIAEREQYIAGKVAQTWTVEQIAGRMSRECHEQQLRLKPSIAGCIKVFWSKEVLLFCDTKANAVVLSKHVADST